MYLVSLFCMGGGIGGRGGSSLPIFYSPLPLVAVRRPTPLPLVAVRRPTPLPIFLHASSSSMDRYSSVRIIQ